MEVLRIGGDELELERVPSPGRQPLRAWDAADELVLHHLADQPARGSMLLVGDTFGALATALSSSEPVVVNDSAAGRAAIAANLATNGRPPVEVLSTLDLDSVNCPFSTVVIKVPKSLSGLTDALHRLRDLVEPATVVIGAGMVRHIHSSTLDTFTELIGPTHTSLARKKARLIFSEVDASLSPQPSPWPATWTAPPGLVLVNHGAGFSPTQLDIGTRFLLETVESFADLVPPGEESANVVDLGCGNGIVGLRIAADMNDAKRSFSLVATDDSIMAIDAAQASWSATFGEGRREVTFAHTHRLADAVPESFADLVVVNPPFHDDRSLGDQTAWSMFTDSYRTLRTGGRLVVVGNRHLAYHAKLKKIFGHCETLGSNAKFVVQSARKT